jgi:hypothetical protein
VLTAQQVIEPSREEPRRGKSSATANLVRFRKGQLDSDQMGWQQIRVPLSNMPFAALGQFDFAFPVRLRL